jgi:outer membrane protein
MTAGLLLFVLSGCAETPVKVGDNNVEKPLQQVTGLTTEDVEKAAQKPTLNLWDVYALAVKHTETLATNYENVEQAKAQNAQAIGAALPQIYLNGNKTWASSAFIPAGKGNPLFNPANDTAYFSAAETILNGLSEPAALEGSDASIQLQNYNLRYQSQLLLENVANAFYNVLALEESQQALEKSRDLNQQTLDLEKQWQVMGRSRTADVSNTQAQLAQVLADLETDKYQLAQAREMLATLANIKPDQPLISEETYSPPSYTVEEAEAKMEDRPDVKAAASSVVVADAQLLAAHGLHLPTITAQGQYWLDYDKPVATNVWNVQLVASLPIFTGGQDFAQEDQYASKKRQAELQLSLTRRTAADDIREAYKSLTNSMAETDAYEKAVQSYQQDYQDVLHDLKLNLTTNLELLQVMTSLETTEVSYIKAKYQTLYDWVWLQVATGEMPKMTASDSTPK